MIAIFNRVDKELVLLSTLGGDGQYGAFMGLTVAKYPAANNVDSRSKGRWPDGIFKPQKIISLSGRESERDGRYGKYFLRFESFGDRVGMGIHSGREDRPDGLKRKGYEHATMGCIRTTEECMEFIYSMRAEDPITELWVRKGGVARV